MSEIEQLIQSVRGKAERLLADLDVGASMTIRLDKKTTFTGKVVSAKIQRVTPHGRVVRAVFTVTLANANGMTRNFDVARIPTRS